MISELLEINNKKCPDIILIDENYCLNDSFDIMQENFTILLNKLNEADSNSDEREIIINRYEKGKEKYQKFLTYVNQFSGNWLSAVQTFNTYKDFWRIKNTPLEIVYSGLIDIKQWGSYNKGVISEDTFQSSKTLLNILKWINAKYPYGEYGVYEKLNLNIYIKSDVTDTLDVDVYYDEDCEAGGGKATVCCSGCNNWGGLGHKGCNKSIVNGHKQCANMYDWCPGTSGRVTGFAGGGGSKGINSSSNCATGSCLGWGEGFNSKNWKPQRLSISHTIKEPDTNYTVLLGAVKITLKSNYNNTTKRWEWIRQ
jgi:hypothetical protein